MNHRRGHSRKQVRCRLCTSGRDYIGADRRIRNEILDESPRVTNGVFWDWCPDCDGTGKCECCPDKICVLCGGTKIVDFAKPRSA